MAVLHPLADVVTRCLRYLFNLIKIIVRLHPFYKLYKYK